MGRGLRTGREPVDWRGVVEALMQAGHSVQKISEYCDCDSTSVRYWLKRHDSEPSYSLGAALLRMYRIKFPGAMIPQHRNAIRPDV